MYIFVCQFGVVSLSTDVARLQIVQLLKSDKDVVEMGTQIDSLWVSVSDCNNDDEDGDDDDVG